MAFGLNVFSSNYHKPSGGLPIPILADSAFGEDVNGAPGDSVTVTLGSPVSAGDFIVLAALTGSPNTLATPSGFTKLYGDGSVYGLFTKKATGSEGASFTVSTVNTAGILIGAKITGANATTQVSVSSLAASLTSPSVTTPSNNNLILSVLWVSSNTVLSTPPTGMTLAQHDNIQASKGGPFALALAWKNQATAGASGTFVWPSGTVFEVATIAIQP